MARTVTLKLIGSIEEWAKDIPDEKLPAEIISLLTKSLGRRTPFDHAIELFHENLQNIPLGLEFEIPQVIGAEGWERLDRGSKLGLGKLVKGNQDAFGVQFIRTTVSRHAVYKKR